MGLPDYHLPIDITLQSLAEIIQRPIFGAASFVKGTATATANDDTVIFTISGEGIIYGGFAGTDSIATFNTDRFYLKIDGTTLLCEPFAQKNDYNLIDHQGLNLNLTIFDATNWRGGVSFPYGISFETEIQVIYVETYGRTPTLRFAVSYSLA